MYFQREEEKTQLTGTAWAPGKRDLKSHSQTGKPLLTFSGEAVFRARPLWKIKSFMKRKDQTGGSENANANTGGRCRKRLERECRAGWRPPGWFLSATLQSLTGDFHSRMLQKACGYKCLKMRFLKPWRNSVWGTEVESCWHGKQRRK